MDQYPQESSQIFNEAPPLVYAGFWERVGAAILDALILAVPNYLLSLVTGFSMADYVRGGSWSAGYLMGYAAGTNLLTIIIDWLYHALQESSATQATLGKRALNIKVVGSSGERITFLNATGRYFSKWISFMMCCVGFLWPLWDQRRQAIHDKIAGTYVANA